MGRPLALVTSAAARRSAWQAYEEAEPSPRDPTNALYNLMLPEASILLEYVYIRRPDKEVYVKSRDSGNLESRGRDTSLGPSEDEERIQLWKEALL